MIKDQGWDTLEMRRRQFRLTLMYKLTHGLVDIDSREYLIQHYERRTRGSHQFKVPINPKLLFRLNKYMCNSEQNGAKIFDFGQNRNFL